MSNSVPVRLYCQWGIVYVAFHGFKRKVFKILEKITCRNSTWIEHDSFGNLNFSQVEGLYTTDKSSVVWNGSASGVNLKKFDIKHKEEWNHAIRDKYSIENDAFVIGFIGRIKRDKGINELFAACKTFFESNQNSVLLLVGNSEKSETINEELYYWSLNEKRVIYCGRTNEVEKYLSVMSVFILPSYRMGVPVIITYIPGPTDAMLDGKTGLIVEKADVNNLK